MALAGQRLRSECVRPSGAFRLVGSAHDPHPAARRRHLDRSRAAVEPTATYIHHCGARVYLKPGPPGCHSRTCRRSRTGDTPSSERRLPRFAASGACGDSAPPGKQGRFDWQVTGSDEASEAGNAGIRWERNCTRTDQKPPFQAMWFRHQQTTRGLKKLMPTTPSDLFADNFRLAGGPAGAAVHGGHQRADLTGQTFGCWVVRRTAERRSDRSRFHCRCSCGTTHQARADHLLSGRSRSCGHERVKGNSQRRSRRRSPSLPTRRRSALSRG
jgi:hypothetical protein